MNKLQELREEAGISQHELGLRSDVDQEIIALLEVGQPVASLNTLNKLADALGAALFEKEISVSPDDLLALADPDQERAAAQDRVADYVQDEAVTPLVKPVSHPTEGLTPQDMSNRQGPPEMQKAQQALENPQSVPDSFLSPLSIIEAGRDTTEPDAAIPEGIKVIPASEYANRRAEGGTTPQTALHDEPSELQKIVTEQATAEEATPAGRVEAQIGSGLSTPTVIRNGDQPRQVVATPAAGGTPPNTGQPALATNPAAEEVKENPGSPPAQAPTQPDSLQTSAPRPLSYPLPQNQARAYALPTSTRVAAIAGVGAVFTYLLWRSWRRSSIESQVVIADEWLKQK